MSDVPGSAASHASPASQVSSRRRRSPSEEGEIVEDTPPLPDEEPPPLPAEPVPDDGWEHVFSTEYQAWYFVNSHTGARQWENPRVPSTTTSTGPPGVDVPTPTVPTEPPAEPYMGYNPKIHGDYDPTAPYAEYHEKLREERQAAAAPPALAPSASAALYAQSATFNRSTGAFQAGDLAERHNDFNKSRRQLDAFYNVDAATQMHDGKSHKAERQRQKLSKAEIKEYNKKRREKKEEKRRKWLKE